MDMGFIQNDIRDRKSESYRKREREKKESAVKE